MSPGSLCLLIVSVLSPGEGEQLLREMDAKIAAAKTLRVEFVIDMESGGKLGRGWLALADGNRFRHEVNLGGDPSVVISDGKRVGTPRVGDEGSLFPDVPLPAWHNEVLQSWLGRGGTFLSLLSVSQWLEGDPDRTPGTDERPQSLNAKLLPDEQLNGVKTRVVEYDLVWSVPPADFRKAKARVWIDPKTKLPVRRTMAFGTGDNKFTATHTKFETDVKLDDKLFEIPNGK